MADEFWHRITVQIPRQFRGNAYQSEWEDCEVPDDEPEDGQLVMLSFADGKRWIHLYNNSVGFPVNRNYPRAWRKLTDEELFAHKAGLTNE